MDIKEKINQVLDEPGVYIFKDKESKIIYVGKAVSLRQRIKSYFCSSGAKSIKMQTLVSQIEDMDYIATSSEAEALILESNLIKEHQPRYNVAYRDDKNYPLLKLTVNEEFPRLVLTRKLDNDGAVYFGRYTDAKVLRRAVKFLRRVFPLCRCRVFPKKPCLDFYLGLCPGPCAGKISKEEYMARLKEMILFLRGKKTELIEGLSKKMQEASGSRNYEEALRIRDQIEALTRAIPVKTRARFEADLGRLVGLKKTPQVIEAIDVSNIRGQEAVGALICFRSGRPDKACYRKYRIKTVPGIDDYRMIREVIQRRYTPGEAENCSGEAKGFNGKTSELALPDLIIIDGGQGHASTAIEQLQKLGLGHIPVMGIAKAFEHIYLPGRKEPLILSANSKVLHLIMRIRDEAHRFALAYHHTLRKKITRQSQLDIIPGIGEVKKRELMRHFGTLGNIRRASIQDLKKVDYIDQKTAERIKEYLS